MSDQKVKYTGSLPENTYHKYCSNIYSQNGEDGILEQLLKELGIESGTCCEFGASDGISGSNTLNLVKNKNFRGLFLEADVERYKKCIENLRSYPKAISINTLVDGINLQMYLGLAGFPKNFDVLSIDVDSVDYDIWKDFENYKPKIVIIETNSYRDPIFEEYNGKPSKDYEPFDPLKIMYPTRIACGTSFLPLVKLGLEKGYIPVAFTGNLLFVDKSLVSSLKEFPSTVSTDPYDYIHLYTNLILWDNEWFTNAGLRFNTAIRNYYMEHGIKKIDYNWNIAQMNEMGDMIWNKKVKEKVGPFQYKVPANIQRIKIDIGLSYAAPQSQVWLEKEKDLFVFGFEPNRESVQSIQSGNIQKRDPSHGEPLSEKNKERMCVFPYALSNVESPTEMDFYITEKDCGTSSLFEPTDPSLGEVKGKIKVPVYSLSHFFDTFPWDRFPFIEYIKIDAQGADLDILKGAGQYLADKVVFVTAEPAHGCYKNCDHNTEESIQNYMQSIGFIQISHPNTADPTFVNTKFASIARDIFIYQRG